LWYCNHQKKGYNPIAMQDYSLQKFDHIALFTIFEDFGLQKNERIALPTSQRQVRFPKQGKITMKTCTMIIHGFSSYQTYFSFCFDYEFDQFY
jgi:hypothetical protein